MIKEKYTKNIKETSISISNSVVDAVRFKNDTKTSLRVYEDGYIGIAGAIGKYDEAELEKEAAEALKQKIKYPCSPSAERQEKVDKRADFIKDDQIVNEVDDLLYCLRKEHPDFIFSNKINLTETRSVISNDRNLKLEYADRGIEAQVLYKHKDSSSLFEGGIECLERKYDKKLLLKEFDIMLNAFNNKVDLPGNKKYPVAFLSYAIPVTKFMSDLEGNIFGAGTSLFSNKTGQKIFNENFTLYQSLNPEDVINVPFFDSEGTVNPEYKYALIENGILKAPYTDKKTAQKFNLPLTGSAYSDYDGVPSAQPINFKVRSSQKSLKELFGGEVGILAYIAEGGDYTPRGDFGTPAQLAFLFDGENLIGRLPEIQLSSNIFDMYGSAFRGVSKDTFLPFCSEKLAVMDLMASE